jgi:hypothetical protein
MWLYPIFRWFQANPLAQWIAGISAALAAFWGWMTLRDRRRDREKEREIELEAQDKSRQVIAKAEEKTDETIRKSDEARADIPRGAPSGELPKPVQDILFDD